VLAGAFCWSAAPAFADESKDTARTAFQRGVEAFEAGSYEAAASLFGEAYELQPTWKLKFNIGQCAAALKRYGLAIEAFEAYLAGGGDDVPDARRDTVLEELDRLRKMVGLVKVTAPKGATIFVDGMERGRTPLVGSLPVAAGVDHEIWIGDGPRSSERTQFKLMGQEQVVIDLRYDDEVESPAAMSDSAPPSEPEEGTSAAVEPRPAAPEGIEDGGKLAPWGFGAIGVGGAVLIGSIVTGGMALSRSNELEEECPDASCGPDSHAKNDRMQALATATDVLIGVGSAIAVAGIVMVVVAKTTGEGEAEADARVSVLPLVGPGFAGTGVQGRF